MEYVEGRTLRELMHDGRPLDVDTALEVTARVLSALEYSHRAGIVHRDIKPANVMMTTNGDVKVMDFGIARAMADASSTMTQTQAVIGTAQYLSPEQARGETVDARSDLYSAGCLLFELLTGRPPFVADSPVAVAYQHVREEPQPPSAFNAAVPPAVDRIVLHALAKDRETRYQTAAEFRADIEAALAGRPISAVAAGAAAGAAGAATTQFLGAPGAGTRTMQPVTEPVPGAYGGTAVAPVGGGLLPAAAVEEEYSYSRGDRPPESGRTNRTGTYVLLALAILIVAGLVAYTVSKLGSTGTPPVQKIAVPSVLNQDVTTATAALKAKGFTNIATTTANNDADKGTVFAQAPQADTQILPTDKITLSVSAGPGNVTVPNGLKGQDINAVRKALEDAGFKVGDISSQDAPNLKQNQLVKTDPAEGSSAPKGSTVNLVVATGNVEVPNVRNKSLSVAIATLQRAGLQASGDLQYRNVPADQTANVVVATDPTAGTKVPVGTTVTMTVTRPTQPTPTPTPTESPSPSESPTPTP
jgi:serine/threonine-protein kinase